MPTFTRLAALLLAGALLAPTALAGPGDPGGDAAAQTTANGTVAIRADVIYPGDGPALRGGVILVKGGKIVAVGPSAGKDAVEIPEGARVLSARAVIPGLVDAYSYLAGTRVGDEPLRADRLAATNVDRFADHDDAVAGGVTTAYAAATGRLVGGQGAIVRLAGPASERLIATAASLEVALGNTGLNAPSQWDPIYRPSTARPHRAAPPRYPTTKMAELALLRHILGQATRGEPINGSEDTASDAVWREVVAGRRPLMIRADKASDILRALALADDFRVRVVLVGAAEAYRVTDEIARRQVPVVVRGLAAGDRSQPYADPRNPRSDEGQGRLGAAAALAKAGIPVAIAVAEPNRIGQLLFNASVAIRAGMTPEQALASVTATPAAALGMTGKLGAIREGASADLVLMSDQPFAAGAHVERVLVAGNDAYRRRSLPDPAPSTSLPLGGQLTAIKAGTILTVSRGAISPGVILVSRGKIVAVGGAGLPIPEGAQVIDASKLTVAPGMIDAYSHLGVSQLTVPGLFTRSSPLSSLSSAGVPLHLAVDPADPALRRALANGLTAALLAPQGSRPLSGGATLIKLAGKDRDAMLVREHAAVVLSASAAARSDRLNTANLLKAQVERGKKYHEIWEKYLERKKKGVKAEKKVETVKVKKNDPISGTWESQISFRGRVFQRLNLKLQLEGTSVTGEASARGQAQPITEGSWDPASKQLRLVFRAPQGALRIEAELVDKDQLEGKLIVPQITLDFTAERTSGGGGTTTRKRDSDRPKTVRPLEPFRPLFAGDSAVLVHADSADEIKAAVELLRDQYDFDRVAVVGGAAARLEPGLLLARGVPVILGPQGARRFEQGGRSGYLPGILHRLGVPVALGSSAYDGAALLPLAAAEATRHGLPGNEALRAVTINTARLLGVADRLGSIEPGKDADLVFWTGHPMAPASRVERVMVTGKDAYRRSGK